MVGDLLLALKKFGELPELPEISHYSIQEYIRFIGESNALEDIKLNDGNDTQTLNNDFAFRILKEYQQKVNQFAQNPLSQLYKNDLDDFLNTENQQDNTRPEVTNHVIALFKIINVFQILSLLFKEQNLIAQEKDKRTDIVDNMLEPWLIMSIKNAHNNLTAHEQCLSGQWKKEQNNLGDCGPVVTSPDDVEEYMEKWAKKLFILLREFYNKETKYDIFDVVAWATHTFLCIHPFQDGNGRMARILLNAILISFIDLKYPLIIIGNNKRDKKKYINALRPVDRKSESFFHFNNLEHMQPYSDFIKKVLGHSLRSLDNRLLDTGNEGYQSIFAQ